MKMNIGENTSSYERWLLWLEEKDM
jgi:hypothetical protein